MSSSLRDAKIELQSARKQLDEARIANEQAERAKTEIGTQLKHLQLLRQDQDKEVHELLVRIGCIYSLRSLHSFFFWL